MSRLPDRATMVAAIIDTYNSATIEQADAGFEWYPMARRILNAIADECGMPFERVALALAALSPRNPWLWNVADTYIYAHAAARGESMPTATTYGRNQRAAWSALTDGADPWRGSALKVREFAKAAMGDVIAVVVDVWTMRVATRGAFSTPANDREYYEVVGAFIDAARELGSEPATVQAITWVVARQAGGIARPYKKGTPDAVRAIVEEARGS